MAQNCLICNSKNIVIKNSNFQGYMEGTHYDMYFCEDCNTCFAFPMEVDENIYHNIYLNGDKVPGYGRYFYFSKDVKKTFRPLNYLSNVESVYWGVKKFLEDNYKTKNNVRILEVGCGLGYLTYALNKIGYKVNGLDISQKAIENAKKEFGNFYFQADIFELQNQITYKFDSIILTEVIEHIPNPLEFIECMLGLIKPGGKILITTPNKNSCFDRNEYWDTELPPVHLWWFSKESFLTISKKLNCEIDFIDLSEFHKYDIAKEMNLKNDYKPWRNQTFDDSGRLLFFDSNNSFFWEIRKLLIEINLWKTVRALRFKLDRSKKIILTPNRICAVFKKVEL